MTESADPLAIALHEVRERFGEDAFVDRRRLISLLADRLPGARSEMRAVTSALEDGVPEALSRVDPSLLGMEIDRQVDRLQSSTGMRADVARATVRAFAYALGLGPPPSVPVALPVIPAPPPPQPPQPPVYPYPGPNQPYPGYPPPDDGRGQLPRADPTAGRKKKVITYAGIAVAIIGAGVLVKATGIMHNRPSAPATEGTTVVDDPTLNTTVDAESDNSTETQTATTALLKACDDPDVQQQIEDNLNSDYKTRSQPLTASGISNSVLLQRLSHIGLCKGVVNYSNGQSASVMYSVSVNAAAGNRIEFIDDEDIAASVGGPPAGGAAKTCDDQDSQRTTIAGFNESYRKAGMNVEMSGLSGIQSIGQTAHANACSANAAYANGSSASVIYIVGAGGYLSGDTDN